MKVTVMLDVSGVLDAENLLLACMHSGLGVLVDCTTKA